MYRPLEIASWIRYLYVPLSKTQEPSVSKTLTRQRLSENYYLHSFTNAMGNRNKTKRSRGIMLPYMPEEILTEVFVRLPIASLLRLRCVCKSLCSLISSPSFTTAHIAYQKIARKYCSFLYKFHHKYSQNGNFWLLRFDIDNHASQGFQRDIELAITDKPKRSHIYGICNGVICSLVIACYLKVV